MRGSSWPRPRRGAARGRGCRQPPLSALANARLLRQGVFAREEAIGERDLPPALDAELLAEHVAVRLRGSRRDAERVAELVIGQPLGDQLDHLSLPVGDQRWISECLHAGDANDAPER